MLASVLRLRMFEISITFERVNEFKQISSHCSKPLPEKLMQFPRVSYSNVLRRRISALIK